jgi:putative transposase
MKYNPDKHHRRSIRLRGYDYTQAGAYFVTICTRNRECLFGDVVNGEMRLNDAGQIVKQIWAALPQRFSSITVDESIVMPNHFHGIIVVHNIIVVGAGLALPSSAPIQGAASSAPTLGDLIRTFKSISAIRVNRVVDRTGCPLWQRNYYEHVIRNDDSLGRIRQYIADNPLRWPFDPENPDTTHPDSLEEWV